VHAVLPEHPLRQHLEALRVDPRVVHRVRLLRLVGAQEVGLDPAQLGAEGVRRRMAPRGRRLVLLDDRDERWDKKIYKKYRRAFGFSKTKKTFLRNLRLGSILLQRTDRPKNEIVLLRIRLVLFSYFLYETRFFLNQSVKKIRK
jgi:hypothetical protein